MFVGGLAGHGKTFFLLNIARALLAGGRLWDSPVFQVLYRAERVIYLTPEVTLGSFKNRLDLFRLDTYLKDGRMLVRTITEGPVLSLTDPDLLLAARGADVFLDTAIRFMEGDESSASDNQRGLAAGIFGLLQAGARTVIGAHHAPKTFDKATYMSLENVLRGSGDIGAMVGTAWGIKQMDPFTNLIHVENLKLGISNRSRLSSCKGAPI